MSCLIAADVIRQSPLVGHELLPADIAWVSGVEANRPTLNCHLDRSRQRSRQASARILLPAAINVRPSIGRILKDAKDACTIRRTPADLVCRLLLEKKKTTDEDVDAEHADVAVLVRTPPGARADTSTTAPTTTAGAY